MRSVSPSPALTRAKSRYWGSWDRIWHRTSQFVFNRCTGQFIFWSADKSQRTHNFWRRLKADLEVNIKNLRNNQFEFFLLFIGLENSFQFAGHRLIINLCFRFLFAFLIFRFTYILFCQNLCFCFRKKCVFVQSQPLTWPTHRRTRTQVQGRRAGTIVFDFRVVVVSRVVDSRQMRHCMGKPAVVFYDCVRARGRKNTEGMLPKFESSTFPIGKKRNKIII